MCVASRLYARPRMPSAASWATRLSCSWSAIACCARPSRIRRSRLSTRTSSSRIERAGAASGAGCRQWSARLSQWPGSIGLGGLGHHELGAGELGEAAALMHKLIEVAGFHDASALEHQNTGGVADGGKPVRDHECGPSLHDLVE